MVFFWFQQLSLNTKQIFEFSYQLIDREMLLSVVLEVVIFWSDKPSDFHDIIFSVLPSLFKV